ncbi:MAG TPA: uridine diphosphate-N-acetylglucosamine-binding protein YvcK [Candidatus Polarisedimenticolaceae bacterium]|nr:uridine diphosphate-N-acetylglucosamine-binding protein YvcK [Candidatus Polarisedimenticolaceae bacterium]
MKGNAADIIKIGNSKGIRIPKALLQQTGLTDRAELVVQDGQLVVRPEGQLPQETARPSSVGVKAVVIGGGTGSFMLLSALKPYIGNLTAIVTMSDDGGSTGILRDELGVLPPGDVRQCLVALSNTPEYMRELFTYRFEEGTFKGHSFGNLFLTALQKISGGFGEGVKLAEQILQVSGRVIPVTTSDIRLSALMPDGTRLSHERDIQQHDFAGERPLLSLEPQAKVNKEAVKAIMAADMVIVGPGDLYGSIIPVLLPDGMAKALERTKASKVFVANLVNKPDKTKGMKVHEFLEELSRHLNGKQLFDYVMYNTAMPSPALAKRYLRNGELPVEFDAAVLGRQSYKAIGEPLLAGAAEENTSDVLLEYQRSLIRHDGNHLARALMRIYFS